MDNINCRATRDCQIAIRCCWNQVDGFRFRVNGRADVFRRESRHYGLVYS